MVIQEIVDMGTGNILEVPMLQILIKISAYLAVEHTLLQLVRASRYRD